MIKRPILPAAIVAAIAAALLSHFFFEAICPSVPFSYREEIQISGRVLEVVRHQETADVYLTRVRANGREYGKAILVLSAGEVQELQLKAGYTVSSSCTCRPFRAACNFGNYDEQRYYASKGIFLRADSKRTKILDRSVWIVREFLNELREQLVQSIYNAVDDPETAGILAAICTGERSGLTEEARKLYQKSGIIHILAISGLHISLLGMTVFRLMRRRFRYLPAAAVTVFFMLCFCVMSDASPSAVRATIMFVIRMIGMCLGKQVDSLCSIALSLLLMLAFQPLLILNSGFLLSYSAILGAALVYPVLRTWFYGSFRSGYQMKKVPAAAQENRWKRRAAESFLLSLSVNLVILPVSASVYFKMPVYSVLLNLLVIPLMSFVLGTGLAGAVIGLIRILAGRFFAGLGVYLVWFIRWCCLLTEQLPFHQIVAGHPESWRLCCYYALLAGMLLLIRRGRSRLPDRRENRKGTRRNGRKAVSVCVLTLCMISVLCIGKTPASLRISFLDVGQGDGILLQNPSGTVYLIDGGSSSVTHAGTYRMESAILYYGIDAVDYVIITHPDTDHISGVMELLEDGDISIRSIWMPAMRGNENYEMLCQTAKEHGVRVAGLHAGIRITDGDLVMTCLHPGRGFASESANAYSAVMDIRYGNFSALMTGDLEAEEEQLLLKKKPEEKGYGLKKDGYDVLKVAHHGSRYSSTEEFLQRVSPQTAVISAGENNVYGHPHEETIKRLRDTGAEIYVTAQSGEIILEAEKDGSMKIRTKK